MTIGLRIDVDTLRGTKVGVPNLCRLLARYSIPASFFFSVGPDNMGRHLKRLLRPGFLIKMLRTRAASLYGWDILLMGIFRPGPVIGEKAAAEIHSAARDGHEIGLHAWDHYAWQAHIDKLGREELRRCLQQAFDLLTQIIGRPPVCSAAPAWKCNKLVLEEKLRFPFSYNSDCRGKTIFYPLVGGEPLSQPQIPVTLPTYDEVVGRKGVLPEDYNEHLLSLLKPDALNVLTIHAEVEGIFCLGMFEDFIRLAKAGSISLVPLGALLDDRPSIGRAAIVPGPVVGREGWVSHQAQRQPV